MEEEQLKSFYKVKSRNEMKTISVVFVSDDLVGQTIVNRKEYDRALRLKVKTEAEKQKVEEAGVVTPSKGKKRKISEDKEEGVSAKKSKIDDVELALAALVQEDTEKDDVGKKDVGKKDSSKRDPGKRDSEKKDAGKKDAGKKDSGKTDSEKKDSGKKDAGKKDSGKTDSEKKDSGKKDAGKKDSSKRDSSKTYSEKKDSTQTDSEKKDSGKTDSEKKDSTQTDSEKKDSGKTDSEKKDSTQTDSEKKDSGKKDSGKKDPSKTDSTQTDSEKKDAEKKDSEKGSAGKEDVHKEDVVKEGVGEIFAEQLQRMMGDEEDFSTSSDSRFDIFSLESYIRGEGSSDSGEKGFDSPKSMTGQGKGTKEKVVIPYRMRKRAIKDIKKIQRILENSDEEYNEPSSSESELLETSEEESESEDSEESEEKTMELENENEESEEKAMELENENEESEEKAMELENENEESEEKAMELENENEESEEKAMELEKENEESEEKARELEKENEESEEKARELEKENEESEEKARELENENEESEEKAMELEKENEESEEKARELEKENEKEPAACSSSCINYFEAQSSRRNITSDNTLKILKNPTLNHKELNQIVGKCKISPGHRNAIKSLINESIMLFSKWDFLLKNNFNILLYGLGSKREIVNNFVERFAKKYPLILVNGFFPDLSIREITEKICRVLEIGSGQTDITGEINRKLNEYHVEIYIVVNNIEGLMLRNKKTQTILSQYARMEGIHMLATIDHINAPLMWDKSTFSDFNWLWYDATTFLNYTEEVVYEGNIMLQNSGQLTLSSLRNVYNALTKNSRSIFLLMVKREMNSPLGMARGVSFKELYQACRKELLISSDVALRTLLKEFVDHGILKQKKSSDGEEVFVITVKNNILRQFVEDQERR